MEIWQIVVIPVLTVLLGFLARPIEIALLRKRTGAINSIRVLSEFLYKRRGQLIKEAAATEIVSEIDQWLQYPNALGSEAKIAKLVGHICSIVQVKPSEIRLLDRALNALDQRATERDRFPQQHAPSLHAGGTQGESSVD